MFLSARKMKKQAGMTLLEVIIVLGIMGVIAAGVVVLAQRAIDNQNISKLSQALNTIQTGLIQTYRGKASYPVVATPDDIKQLRTALISMGRASESDFLNPFTGDPIDVVTTAVNGVANKAFGIRVSNLSQEQCRSVITTATDLFSFIQVVTPGSAIAPDQYVAAVADTGMNIIKSPTGTGQQFDVSNLEHITNLCGGAAGGTAFYDVYVGGR
ncbi:MAG: type IV pilus major pilin [Enterovibrio sp.]